MWFSRSLRRVGTVLFGCALDKRAGTAIEYGLILAMIVLAIIAALQGLAGSTVGMWKDINTSVANAR